MFSKKQKIYLSPILKIGAPQTTFSPYLYCRYSPNRLNGIYIHKHLLKFLTDRNLSSQSQSGFRPNLFCHTALTKLCDNWLSAINNSRSRVLSFLTFKKLAILLITTSYSTKLSLFIGNSPSVSIFKSYLDRRSQRVLC